MGFLDAYVDALPVTADVEALYGGPKDRLNEIVAVN